MELPNDFAEPLHHWKRAPGWNGLIDRLNLLIAEHPATAGHAARGRIKSKGGMDLYGDCCESLMDAVSAIEDESWITCRECGDPGYETSDYQITCDLHASGG